MGFTESQDAYLNGQRHDPISPMDPNYDAYLRGQEDAGPGGSVGDAVAVIVGNGLGGYLQMLFGAPIGFGVIAGVVALFVGGNFVMAALIAAGVTFAVVLLVGVFVVTVRVLIAFAPLLIVVAMVLYVLQRWFDVGPGLPT
jgi:hypothetical protein